MLIVNLIVNVSKKSEFQEMLLLILFGSLLVIYLVRFYQTVKKLPPGPTPLPLIGNMHQMLYGAFFEGGAVKVIIKWTKQYGPVHSMWMGPYPTVNICDWSIANDVMVKKGAAFANRFLPYNITQHRKGMGIIFTNGDHWSEQRRFALQTLRNFGLGRGVMEQRIMLEVDYRCDQLNMKIEENGGTYEFDPAHFIDILTGNIINRMLLSERFTEGREKKFFELKAAVDKMVDDVNVLDILLNEKTVKIPMFKRRLEKTAEPQNHLVAFFKEQIKQRREEIDSGAHELKGEGDDFVDAFLIEMQKRQEHGDMGSFYDDSLEITLFDLWLGGQETSSTTLYWAFAYLVLNPDVLARLSQELDEVTGRNRPLSLNDKANTPYLNAVISETFRVSTLLPVSMFRTADFDVMAGEYLLPKGTNTAAQIAVIMNDDASFKDPFKFDPSRYLDNARLDQQVVAFGMGKRACPGESLARAEIYLVLGNMVARFNISPVAGSTPQMMAKSEKGTLRKAQNYQMSIQKR